MAKRGRRSSGGVKGPLSVLLRRRIESSLKNSLTTASVEQLVGHLRSTYTDYSNQKLQPFTSQVHNILQLLNPNLTKKPKTDRTERDGDGELSTLASVSESDDSYSSDDDGVYGEKADLMRVMLRNTYNQHANSITMSKNIEYVEKQRGRNVSRKKKNSRKKRKRDSSEQRLQLLEAKHVEHRQRNKQEDGDGESSALASISESSDSYSSSEEIEPLSSSEKPDLMQIMLQNADNKQAKKAEYVVNHDNNDEKGKKNDILKQRSDDSDGNGGPRFKDLGGMDAVLEELRMEVIVPLYHPQLFSHLGVRPMSGILFHGPPGCGKTKLAHAIANEAGVPFYKLSATELVSGVSGASEENIRELFSKAYRTAPSIVFIDEIDAIASKRENLQREMERRIVTQLMTCMDESHRPVKPDDNDSKGTTLPTDKRNSEAKSDGEPGYVLVIAATNRPDAIDPALRRPGRFDREIALGIPDENARVQILSVLTRDLRVEGAFDLMKIARSTPGFVGADLASLTNKAGILAVKRIIDARKVNLSRELVDGEDAEEWWRKPWSSEDMEKLTINMADFEEAAKLVQPSTKREGFSAIPNVKWEDVGGLDSLRHEFDRYIVRRIKNPKDYMDFGVDLETGFLLYGPPGCGKTLIAKAVANEAGANFIHIKGPEILSKYVGESESDIRQMFARAKTCSPCILFFDEMDSLTTKRDKEGSHVVERLLDQLLIELDGADERKGVYVIGATNRPKAMDEALLRPGRLGRLLYVPLPSPDERGLILKALARKKPIDSSVNLVTFGRVDACKNLSGADLAALMNEAAMLALEDKLAAIDAGSVDLPSMIKESHFKRALEKISPSVSDEQIKDLEEWKRDS